MGFLHDGHLSLIKYANENSDLVVTTLFINPLQFGPNEDFVKYPRDVESDSRKAEENGADILFIPQINDMYSDSFQTNIQVKEITSKFEGVFRPGHFDGVATVVNKLFNAVKPHLAIFGRKDYQQTLLIKRMVNDLNMNIDIIVRPTVREKDGLAKSSRNVYLNDKNRAKATILYKALKETEQLILNGERERLTINRRLNKILNTIPDIRIDYAVAALAENLDEPKYFDEWMEIVLLIAVHLGNTRLIDNLIVKL
jgi:pantoate--beta-alanine ligase